MPAMCSVIAMIVLRGACRESAWPTAQAIDRLAPCVCCSLRSRGSGCGDFGRLSLYRVLRLSGLRIAQARARLGRRQRPVFKALVLSAAFDSGLWGCLGLALLSDGR